MAEPAVEARTDAEVDERDIGCITQDPVERMFAKAEYLAVCTGRADLVALSRSCLGTGCGGHPICRPCFEVGQSLGWIVKEDAHG